MYRGWDFIDEKGSFELDAPHKSSSLYFPLANEYGMMSSISPALNGDIKSGQNTFFNIPVSSDDLHNLKSSRNFWVYIHGRGAWSATGVSSMQTANSFVNDSEENAKLEAGFLWHKLTRINSRLGVKSEVTSFVPVQNDRVELMRVRITNIGPNKIIITPTAAIPVFGRSADNVRDHRHVTGLLNRIHTTAEGIEVRPVMTFDERGHKPNTVSYNVYGADDEGNPPVGSFPGMEEFIGEGGCLEWPEIVVTNIGEPSPPGKVVEGYEAIGALRFKDEELKPGESKAYVIALSITENQPLDEESVKGYLSVNSFSRHLNENIGFWEEKLGKIGFGGSDKRFDLWMKWVSLQPVLRRIYGCSFMPHHDYGKGGRGWRDLWQDCLALLLMEPETVRTQLFNNFGGVRMDGSNATIIGKQAGEFVADRNNISRVWSDHGVWPLFTTMLYIDQTGDVDFLFEQQSYFKDRLIMRSREIDGDWSPSYGNRQRCADGSLYTGTILEHILLQNVVAFYNVGRNHNVRLENADWNDGLDMAYDNGETVAFTSFYAGNLMEAARLLREVKRRKALDSIDICSEMTILFDNLYRRADYDSYEEKQALLHKYFEALRHEISGDKISLSLERLAEDLVKKALWLTENIQKNELVKSSEGYEWFNGYYDNKGRKVEGEFDSGVRMTLTGQVFPLMMGVASEEQASKAAAAARRYLFDARLRGYRLNTDFNEVKLDLGRCFGFAYGHKENGSVFSHMAVMYAYALYTRGFVSEGYEVVASLYGLSSDFEKARIYPGIPEYFNDRGRGMYHYLTGSASWLLLLMLNQVYGIRGKLGDLVIDPKLKESQFDDSSRAYAKTVFAGRKLSIVYRNDERLDYGSYSIGRISADNSPVDFRYEEGAAVIGRDCVLRLDPDTVHNIEIILVGRRNEGRLDHAGKI